MKIRAVLFGLLLGCIALLPQLGAQNAKDKDKDKKEPEKVDITAQVREMNSDKFASPPTEFRAGHVNPKAIDAKAITKTDTGFTIKLPSGAPIPTPTVYKGKLYVSGGFSTKEYFCFDAVSGKFEWGMSLDDDGPTSAVVEDDTVVFNTESCTIFALDAKTGKHLWSYFLGDPLTSTPTIANGKVYTSYPAMGGGEASPWTRKNAPPGRETEKGRSSRPAGSSQTAAGGVACHDLPGAEDGQNPVAKMDRQRRHVGPGRRR